MARPQERSESEAYPRATLQSYVVGFVLSLITTLSAFGLVMNNLLAGSALVVALVALAAAQLIVQLVCFLHLGLDKQSRWRTIAFLFMIGIIIIIVGGSLWIMSNLHYNMMPAEMDEYMLEQSKKGF